MTTDKRKQQLREAQQRHREKNKEKKKGYRRIETPPLLIEKVKQMIKGDKE